MSSWELILQSVTSQRESKGLFLRVKEVGQELGLRPESLLLFKACPTSGHLTT